LVSIKFEKEGMENKKYMGRDAIGNEEFVEDQWVEKSFHVAFTRKLEQHAGKWHIIPPGDRRKNSTKDKGEVGAPVVETVEEESRGRKRKRNRKAKNLLVKKPMMWVQGQDKTCVYTSMANCMSWLGKTELAWIIQGKAKKSLKSGEPFQKLTQLMEERGQEFSRSVIFKERMFDPFINQAKYPTVAQLCAKDGGVEHAVTFYGDLIFEPSSGAVLRLTKENLDGCVISGYLYVIFAIRFQNDIK
jgi:hypothetical protein